MGLVQKDAFRTMIITYAGIVLGYLNKGLLFLLILTTEEIGLVNLIFYVGTLFAQFANLGTVYTTWKFLPFFKNKEKKHHGFLPLILLIVCIGILALTSLILLFRANIEALFIEKSPLFVSYFIWIIPIGIAYVLYMVLDIYLRGFYKNIVSVIALEIVTRIAMTILLFLIWMKTISFDAFVIGHSLIYFIPTIILLVYLYMMGELNLSVKSIRISKKFKKIILQFSAFNYVNTLGMVIVNSMDVIMIGLFLGLKETGVYTIVIFLANALQVPYKSMLRVSVPLISDYWKSREMGKMQELYRNFSSAALAIGLALFLVIWLNIDFLFSFLKPEYNDGIWVFLFIMIGRLLDMYFGLNGSIFTTSKKYKFDLIFTILLIGTVFSLNLLFIPWWGIPGAAISTSIALLVYNFGRILFVWFTLKIHPFVKNQFVIIGLALITIFVGWQAGNAFDNKWIDLVVESFIVLVVFLLPIYIFNLEPQTVNYVRKGIRFVKSKF